MQTINREVIAELYLKGKPDASFVEVADFQEKAAMIAEFRALIHKVVKYGGLAIGLEYMPGDIRFKGTGHERKLRSAYGHIRGYAGNDGEALDCYVNKAVLENGSNPPDEGGSMVHVVRQVTRDGGFDEEKVMIGWAGLEEAKAGYLAEMPESFLGSIEGADISALERYKRAAKVVPEPTKDEDENELDYAEIDLSPTDAMRSNAKRGLELRKAAPKSRKGGLTASEAAKQGIGSGVQRASNIVNSANLPAATWKRMKAYFDRHQSDKSGEGWGSSSKPSKGYIAWLLWGGDAGWSRAKAICAALDRAAGKSDNQEFGDLVIEDYFEFEPEFEGEAGDRFKFKAIWRKAYAEAKSKFSIFPSAYASAFIVKKYKELVKESRGNLDGAFEYAEEDFAELHEEELESFEFGFGAEDAELNFDIGKWFKEDWVRISASGEIMGECGGREDGEGKPKCMPRKTAESMSVEERKTAVVRKRKEDPDPDREGKAVNVKTKTEEKSDNTEIEPIITLAAVPNTTPETADNLRKSVALALIKSVYTDPITRFEIDDQSNPDEVTGQFFDRRVSNGKTGERACDWKIYREGEQFYVSYKITSDTIQEFEEDSDFSESRVIEEGEYIAELTVAANGLFEACHSDVCIEDTNEYARVQFAGNTKKTKNCVKGLACGYSCINTSRECQKPLDGQYKKHSEWLLGQGKAKEQNVKADTAKKEQDTKEAKAQEEKAKNEAVKEVKPKDASSELQFVTPPTKQRDINKLEKEVLKVEDEGKKLFDSDKATYSDNYGILVSTRIDMSMDSNRFRALKDGNGVLQGMASVVEKPGSIHIEYLATSPWNVKPGDKRYTRGVGSKMMEQVVLESAKKGKGGTVTLDALPGAVGFYEKIGFKSKGQAKGSEDGVLTMELSPSAAKEFLAKRGITDYAEADNDNERFNSELLDLEDEANGAFCSSKGSPTPTVQEEGEDSAIQAQQGVE